MTNEEMDYLADELFKRLMKRNEEDTSEEKFVVVYESESEVLIDNIFEEITRLKSLIVEYEENNKFELAAQALKKIERLENEIERYLK